MTKEEDKKVVNWYVTDRCNARCKMCFSRGLKGGNELSVEDGKRLLCRLAEEGCSRINFVGGEPTIHSKIGEYIEYTNELGMKASLVSNGYNLEELLSVLPPGLLSMVGLSIDSAEDKTIQEIGRSGPGYLSKVEGLCRKIKSYGAILKINIVVTKWNLNEDLSEFILKVQPDRVKIFQALRVEGHNENVECWVSEEEYQKFVQRHMHLKENGIEVVSEDNNEMVDAYIMIDPHGRTFGNTDGKHQQGPSVLEEGLKKACEAVGFDYQKYVNRGGDWENSNKKGGK